jgi:uncharacterized membrane protein YcaP (DUF421 family)
VLSGVLMLLAVVVIVRITGLRSLAKMSSFDFTVTVAIGSILGSVVASGSPISQGAVAVASLLGVQWLIAQFRRGRSARRWSTTRRSCSCATGSSSKRR